MRFLFSEWVETWNYHVKGIKGYISIHDRANLIYMDCSINANEDCSGKSFNSIHLLEFTVFINSYRKTDTVLIYKLPYLIFSLIINSYKDKWLFFMFFIEAIKFGYLIFAGATPCCKKNSVLLSSCLHSLRV